MVLEGLRLDGGDPGANPGACRQDWKQFCLFYCGGVEICKFLLSCLPYTMTLLNIKFHIKKGINTSPYRAVCVSKEKGFIPFCCLQCSKKTGALQSHAPTGRGFVAFQATKEKQKSTIMKMKDMRDVGFFIPAL